MADVVCSFCQKGQHEVQQMIAGPSVLICDECVDLCTTILDEVRSKVASQEELDAARDALKDEIKKLRRGLSALTKAVDQKVAALQRRATPGTSVTELRQMVNALRNPQFGDDPEQVALTVQTDGE